MCNRRLGTYLNSNVVRSPIASRTFHNTAILSSNIEERVKRVIAEQLGVKTEEVGKFSSRSS